MSMQGFFNTGGRRESEPSRPKYVNPRTGDVQSWQRASNFAAPLESAFGMIKHKTRQVVRGVNKRADLARMLLTGAVEGEKVDEVITTALSAAEDEAKANNGTAVHAALGLCDTGHDVPEEYWPHARGYVAELKRYGLRPVAAEQRILNTRLGATGTFDRVYVTDSGRYLVGDIKTGRLDYSAHKFAVQLEVYAGADFIVHENDAASAVEPIPWRLDQDAALVVHVDPESGATSIYEVPLRVARWGAALAEDVRAFQRTDILLPYSGAPAGPLLAQLHTEAATDVRAVPEVVHAPMTVRATDPAYQDHAIAALRVATHAEQPEHMAQHPAPDAVTVVGRIEQHPATASAADHIQQHAERRTPLEWSKQLGAEFHVLADPDGQWHTAMTLPEFHAYYAKHQAAPAQQASPSAVRGVIALGSDEYQTRMDELMHSRNNKAKLQRMLHDLGGKDLAHNRKRLAERIIEMENSIGASQQNALGNLATPEPQTATTLAATIEQDAPAAETTPFLLKQISEAASIGDIQRLHENIIARSGEGAWSTAMRDVAAQRVIELDQVGALTDLAEIEAATTTQQLAGVWHRVTSNGATLSLWTPELDAAAKKRNAEIQAAQPANPNPWGSV